MATRNIKLTATTICCLFHPFSVNRNIEEGERLQTMATRFQSTYFTKVLRTKYYIFLSQKLALSINNYFHFLQKLKLFMIFLCAIILNRMLIFRRSINSLQFYAQLKSFLSHNTKLLFPSNFLTQNISNHCTGKKRRPLVLPSMKHSGLKIPPSRQNLFQFELPLKYIF